MIVCSPVGVDYKSQYEPRQKGDFYRCNWLGADYLLGSKKIPTKHTGDDIVQQGVNCAGKSVYSVAGGIVTCAQMERSSWGWLVVIKHGPHLFTRYAHFDRCFVKKGQLVAVAQLIGTIGNANGTLPYHLHFDVSKTAILATHPGHWPGLDLNAILYNYMPPLEWLKGNTMVAPVTNPDTTEAMRVALTALPKETSVLIIPGIPGEREPLSTVSVFEVQAQDLLGLRPPVVVLPPPTPLPDPTAKHAVVNAPGSSLNVRAAPINGAVLGGLPNGDSEMVLDSGTPGWWKISGGLYDKGFASAQYLVLVPNP